MKYFIVKSDIKHGEYEYTNNYIIKTNGDLPDDANFQLTCWNYRLDYMEEDITEDGWLEDWYRMFYDTVEDELTDQQVAVLKDFMAVIEFDFVSKEKKHE